MLIIKKIADRKTVFNKKAVKKVQAIMRIQFPGSQEKKIVALPDVIFGEQKMGFNYSLDISINDDGEITGFIIYSFFWRENFYFLDYVAVAPEFTGQGIGSKLYEFLREEAKAKKTGSIFFECLNDDGNIIKDENELKQNIARLKFYEKYGARPIINNKYSAKVKADDNSTLLVFDPLDSTAPLSLNKAKKAALKILQKKYSDHCPPGYIEMVVESFKDDPAIIREAKYLEQNK